VSTTPLSIARLGPPTGSSAGDEHSLMALFDDRYDMRLDLPLHGPVAESPCDRRCRRIGRSPQARGVARLDLVPPRRSLTVRDGDYPSGGCSALLGDRVESRRRAEAGTREIVLDGRAVEVPVRSAMHEQGRVILSGKNIAPN